MTTGIVSAVIIGAIIGGIAGLILPGKQNLSVLLTIVVSIVAALSGTILASVLGVAHTRGDRLDPTRPAGRLGRARGLAAHPHPLTQLDALLPTAVNGARP